MIQLTLLGDVDLRSADDQVVGSVLSQPRRLALLIYLVLESAGGGVQRDRLLGVFWPEQGQDQARQSLRTALHFLRRSLGARIIQTQGAALTVDPGALWCDVRAFSAALASGDPEQGLRLYQGDLLPGFFLDDGPPEFERWLEDRRGELGRAAAAAAWSLAGREEAAGNAPGAGAWARRAARLFHGDEAAVRRSIELLGRIGDRAGALDAYHALAHRLREDFDVEPSPATEAAIALVRGGGDETGGSPGGAPAADRVVPAPRWGAVRRVGRSLYSAAVTVVLVIAFYSLWGLDRGDSTPTGTAVGPILQVEELRDFSADGSAAGLAGALTLELTARLSEASALRVVSLAGAPAANAGQAGTYILRGSVMRSGDLVRVTTMLVDGASGVTMDRITAEQVMEPSSALVSTAHMAEDMARRIRREVGRAVGEGERGVATRNTTALALVRGAVRDMEAADSLRRAGAPSAAHVALAAADSQLARAHHAARRWPEPAVQRAEVAYRQMWLSLLSPGSVPASVPELLRTGLAHTATALAAAPNDPAAHELAGLLNYWTWRMEAGESQAENARALERAEEHLKRATQMDAGRARAWSILSTLLESRGEFAAAKLTAGRAFRADAYLENTTETLLRLFTTSLEVGDMGSAEDWCGEISRRELVAWLPQYCNLELLAWREPDASVTADSVARLIDAAVAASPGASPIHARIRMMGAVVLARSDSPEAMPAIERARAGAAPAADLLALEAWAHLALGQTAKAAALLERAEAADPRGSQAILKSLRFATLRGG
jgi:DNA-binding SARP family transcriptional activator/TolB-like protein/tetratricopeptide (TPR) repeat protein